MVTPGRRRYEAATGGLYLAGAKPPESFVGEGNERFGLAPQPEDAAWGKRVSKAAIENRASSHAEINETKAASTQHVRVNVTFSTARSLSKARRQRSGIAVPEFPRRPAASLLALARAKRVDAFGVPDMCAPGNCEGTRRAGSDFPLKSWRYGKKTDNWIVSRNTQCVKFDAIRSFAAKSTDTGNGEAHEQARRMVVPPDGGKRELSARLIWCFDA